MVLAPESPYHLIAKKKHSKATEVVALLNGRDDIAISAYVINYIVQKLKMYLIQKKIQFIKRVKKKS